MLWTHLRDHVIIPTLTNIGPQFNTKAAVNLLIGTAAVESDMGKYLIQNDGPALGIYQMEPATFKDITINFIQYKPLLRNIVSQFSGEKPAQPDAMVGNLYLATAMARIHYFRVAEPLPDGNNIIDLANYWKKYYNTHLGKGTPEKFLKKWNTHVH